MAAVASHLCTSSGPIVQVYYCILHLPLSVLFTISIILLGNSLHVSAPHILIYRYEIGTRRCHSRSAHLASIDLQLPMKRVTERVGWLWQPDGYCTSPKYTLALSKLWNETSWSSYCALERASESEIKLDTPLLMLCRTCYQVMG